MTNLIRIKKGLDIPLPGKADISHVESVEAQEYAIVPDDFPGVKWKAAVQSGDHIAQGAPLLFAKEYADLYLASPVSGEVKAVLRGERRHIDAVVVESSLTDDDKVIFDVANFSGGINTKSRQEIISLLCKSGVWPMFRQRPYDIVPDPQIIPRDIFVTAFDSAPLAAPLTDTSMQADLERGLEVMSVLTDGRVFLNIPYDSEITSRVAVINEFNGPHPSGNAGVQAAAIKPVNKGEIIWTMDARTVVRVGRLVRTGYADQTAEVAITGPEVKSPCMLHTMIGARVSSLLETHITGNTSVLRIISGNVLTGVRVSMETGFIRFPYRQITVINEGNHADEFMGWASLSPHKYSVKRSFVSKLSGKFGKLSFDARIRGGRRAPILSGEYDKVFPFDIYPEFLLRAIESGDIDKMEQLGIYEVAPEDFALPEFVDTSKQPLQAIVRKGLDYVRNELL